MAASTGNQFSTRQKTHRLQSEPSRFPSQTRTSSTWGQARPASAATSSAAMVSTNRSTLAPPGSLWALETLTLSGDSSSIQKILTSPSWRRSAIPLPIMRSAASSVRKTAARPGRKFFTRMPRPVASTSPSIPPTRTSFMRRYGKRAARPGAWIVAARAAAFTVRSTAAPPGRNCKGHGLPEGVLGRIGVTVSGANPNRVWAVVEAEKGGIYRSDDGGDSWHLTTDDHRFRQRAWYYSHIFADPKSADTVYILNTGAYRSNDGGKTFSQLHAPHGDNHALWIDPTNPKRLINGNDGGATISTNGGDSWTSEYNQPTAQFYHVTTDNQFPYYMYGAQQDNSTVAIASASPDGAIDRTDWYDVGGGESGYIAPDPSDPEIVYAGSYGGRHYALRSPHARRAGDQSVAGESHRLGGSGRQASLPVDGADCLFAARSQDALLCRRSAVQDHRRRNELDDHQPGPDAQRQVEASFLGRADHQRQHRRSRSTTRFSRSWSRPCRKI